MSLDNPDTLPHREQTSVATSPSGDTERTGTARERTAARKSFPGEEERRGNLVIPGLVPGIQTTTHVPSTVAGPSQRIKTANTWQAWIEINPIGIIPLDQVELPVTRPIFHRLLPPDRGPNVGELLEPDEGVNEIPPGER